MQQIHHCAYSIAQILQISQLVTTKLFLGPISFERAWSEQWRGLRPKSVEKLSTVIGSACDVFAAGRWPQTLHPDSTLRCFSQPPKATKADVPTLP